MREVTRYQATDGTLHETAEACERYEAKDLPPMSPAVAKAMAVFREAVARITSGEPAEAVVTDLRARLIAYRSARPPQPRGETRHAD
jgi:hypothetical protein